MHIGHFTLVGWLVGYLACLSRVSCGTDCAELVQVDLARDWDTWSVCAVVLYCLW